MPALAVEVAQELRVVVGRDGATGWTRGTAREAGKAARLAVISNTDDDILEKTRGSLGAPVDVVVSAESVRSYKPSSRNFEEALERMGAASEEVLHVSGFFDYDLGPARELGFRTCFVNRHGRPAPATTDFHVRDLAGLADELGV